MLRTSTLALSSEDDPTANYAGHNPASFIVDIPNATRINGVTKICPTFVSIPRMFNNIETWNNELVWWQRQVVELPTGAPDTYLRTTANDWTATHRLVIPRGIYNIYQLLDLINAEVGPDEVWSFDSTLLTVVVTKTPTDPPVAWGEFVDPGHVPPPVSYANMTYVSSGATSFFDTLGLQKSADANTHTEDLSPFSQILPDSFDAILGSNLQTVNTVPLFDRFAHSYSVWSMDPYTTPRFNPPNLAGPSLVHLILTDVGDSSMISAGSGLASDTVASLSMTSVEWGENATRMVHDGEFEGITYMAPRNVSRFRVSVVDARLRQLSLPRNWPVRAIIQLVYANR